MRLVATDAVVPLTPLLEGFCLPVEVWSHSSLRTLGTPHGWPYRWVVMDEPEHLAAGGDGAEE